MKIYSARSGGKYFIRVCLLSGTTNSPMGFEELAVFCECAGDAPSIDDLDIKGLLKWANGNPAFTKNQSGDSFEVSKQEGSVAVVFLSLKEISCCQSAGRIYPCPAAAS